MTFVEKFEQIKKKFGKVDVSRVTENFAVQVNLIDTDCGGAFYVTHFDGDVAVEPYDYHDNTAMLYIKAKDLVDAIGGKLSIVDAIMGGTVEVVGNVEHVQSMLLLKKPAAKRTTKKAEEATEEKPAKKTCAKRTCAKKTAK